MPTSTGKIEPCKPYCDFTKVVVPRRAVFLCSKCRRDLGIEYLFWWEATHEQECKQLQNNLDKLGAVLQAPDNLKG